MLVGTPAHGIGALLAPAACPAAAKRLELAMLQWTLGVRRLRRCEGRLFAWCLVSRAEVDGSLGAVMPCHRLVPAWVVMGMSVTHLVEEGLDERLLKLRWGSV